MRRIALSVLALTAAVGCARPEFIRTDAEAPTLAAATRPPVHLDDMPGQAFRAVGLVEVRSNMTPEPLEMLLEEAAEEGQARGCDVLVARDVYRVANGLQPVPDTAQRFIVVNGVRVDLPAPPRQFVCGIYPTSS